MLSLLATVRFWRTAFLLLLFAISAVAEVVVIAHPDAPEDSVAPGRLLDFYTGDIRQWEDGTRVVVFDLKEKGDTRDSFFDLIGKSSSRMRTIWLKRMLSGEGDPPVAIESEPQMVRRVALTPGAIGFVQRKHVTDSVKIIATVESSDDD